GCKCNSGSSIRINSFSFDIEASVSKNNSEIIISIPEPRYFIGKSKTSFFDDRKADSYGAIESKIARLISSIPNAFVRLLNSLKISYLLNSTLSAISLVNDGILLSISAGFPVSSDSFLTLLENRQFKSSIIVENELL